MKLYKTEQLRETQFPKIKHLKYYKHDIFENKYNMVRLAQIIHFIIVCLYNNIIQGLLQECLVVNIYFYIYIFNPGFFIGKDL